MTRTASPVHHHGPAHHAPPKKKHGHGGIIAGIAVAALAAAIAAWLALPHAPSTNPTETLLEQMRAAATGPVEPTHAFGGALTVIRANGRVNVTAEGLPSRACVQVGWRLAREGTIIVDGVLPQRLSAAKLSELCAGESASLTWVPDE